MINDIFWMKRALLLAENALVLNKVPVASVLVNDNFELGVGLNFGIYSHAEVNALKQASFYLSECILSDCTLYVTLEPCYVCLSASMLSKVKQIIFGAYYKKYKCSTFLKSNYYDFSFFLKGGLLQEESKNLLYKFFDSIR